MREGPSLFVLAKRDFWALFGAIWLLVGVGFLIVGGGVALREGNYVFAAVGLVVAAVGGAVVRGAVRRIGVERQLRREGLTGEGRVVAVAETNIRYNKRTQWRIHYRYADRTGAEHEGQSGYLDPDEAAAWAIGDRGTVRFDPRDPARSIWIGRPEDL
jgi:hypothetical protein